MRNPPKYSALLLLFIFLIPAAAGAAVNVYVDNKIQNYDVPADQVRGRVMVPLRGVFESLGAKVKYDAGPRRITANRGKREVVLYIGRRDAFIDGRRQTLDVPADTIRGRTMVPLRFVGEALGAKVKWQGSTRSVYITTTAAGDNTTKPGGHSSDTGGPKIDRISVYPGGVIKAGKEVTVTVHGEEGAAATFSVRGMVSNLSMARINEGIYRGKYQVPQGRSVTDNMISVRLEKNGKTTVKTAGKTTEDTAGLTSWVEKVSPSGGSAVNSNRPTITAYFATRRGVSIQRGRVSMKINNYNATPRLQVSGNQVRFHPPSGFSPGSKKVVINWTDSDGYRGRYHWSFNVNKSSSSSSSTSSFNASLNRSGNPTYWYGDNMVVNARGPSGYKATFDIGTHKKNLPMREKSPGVYQGVYKVTGSDRVSNTPIRVRFTKNGKTYTRTTSNQAALVPNRPGGPWLKLTSPSNGARVGNSFQIKGNTRGGSNVKVSRMEGNRTITKNWFKANSAGNFTYTVNMDKLARNRTYNFLVQAKHGEIYSPAKRFNVRYYPTNTGTTRITSVSPSNGAKTTNRRPIISIYLSNTGSSRVQSSNVRITLNGKSINSGISVTSNRVYFRPSSNLPYGSNRVYFRGQTDDGHVVSRNWNFTVEQSGIPIPIPTVIPLPHINASHNATSTLKSGEVFQVNMSGPSGVKPTFNIGSAQTNIPMAEYSSGKYRGTYRVKNSDHITSAPVKINYLYNGHNRIVNLTRRVNLGTYKDTGTSTTGMTISSPQANGIITSTFYVTGKAPPSSQVRIRVASRNSSYRRDFVTSADASGNFRVKVTISPPMPGTQYYISSSAVKGGRTYSGPSFRVVLRRLP